MQAKSNFKEAEQLASEEKFDQAIEKYAQAVELDPGRKAYKLKLLSARTRAAAEHAQKARLLTKQGEFDQALNEYSRARQYNAGIEYIDREITDLQNLVEAERFAEEGAGLYEKGNRSLAGKAIDRALQLDANNARALAINDLLSRDQSVITMDGIELDMASSEPFTLSFKETKIKDVFAVLTKLSGINFIFDEKVHDEKISLFQEKATFAQAMELILQMNGLQKKVLNSKTIIIYPQTREKEKQYDDQVIQTFFLSSIDAKKAVNLLRTMLQLRKVYVHEERNALVVRDKPEVIKLAEQILAAADRENSEVILALELVSVSDADTLKIGTTLSTYSVSVGESKDGTNLVSSGLSGGTVGNAITSLNGLETYFTLPSAIFDFAKTLNSTNILANPKIRVRNKEKAKVHVGTREPIVTTIQTDTSTASNVQYVDVGIKLDVEPNIQLDNTVETKIKLEVSQVIAREEAGSIDAPVTALTIATTNAETVLTLRDGEQTIIGGLFEQTDSRQKTTIPFIGEIPFLGALFSGYDNSDGKREILLSITPYIVKRVNVPDVDVATIWSGGEDNLKSGPNFGAFVQPLQSEVEATTPQSAPAVRAQQVDMSADKDMAERAEVLGETSGDEVKQEVSAGSAKQAASTAAVDEPEESSITDVQAAEEAVPTEVIAEQEEITAPKASTVNFVGPQQVELGKNFAVTVQVNDIEDLYSAPLFVNYDPEVLELVDISEGTFLKQEGQLTVFSSTPNSATGQVIIGYKQGSGGQGASGSGDLFVLNFKPIAVGATRLEVNRVNFRNPQGVRLQVAPETVMIEVR
ncbi:MAG: hypothetical protein IH613_15475 [Desulfuromonadales bacterium]|nr:hypothetical protein [Desulfuromonadales bacterium]